MTNFFFTTDTKNYINKGKLTDDDVQFDTEKENKTNIFNICTDHHQTDSRAAKRAHRIWLCMCQHQQKYNRNRTFILTLRVVRFETFELCVIKY